MDAGVGYAWRKLAWMGQRRIWPNGLRYLWTDVLSGLASTRCAVESPLPRSTVAVRRGSSQNELFIAVPASC